MAETPQPPLDIEGILKMFSATPSEAERRSAGNQALLRAGLAMMQANQPSRYKPAPFGALAAGGMAGMDQYQGALSQQTQDRQKNAVLALEAMKIKKEMEQQEALKRFFSGQQQPPQTGFMPNVPLVGGMSTPGGGQANALTGQTVSPQQVSQSRITPPPDVSPLIAAGNYDAAKSVIENYKNMNPGVDVSPSGIITDKRSGAVIGSIPFGGATGTVGQINMGGAGGPSFAQLPGGREVLRQTEGDKARITGEYGTPREYQPPGIPGQPQPPARLMTPTQLRDVLHGGPAGAEPPQLSPLQIPPQLQAQRDAQAGNIQGGLTPSGAGPAIPSAAVLPATPEDMAQRAAAIARNLTQPGLAVQSPEEKAQREKEVERIAKLKIEEPQARAALATNTSNLDLVVRTAKEVRDSPYIAHITGFGTPLGYVPSGPGARPAGQLSTLKNQLFIKTLQDLRAASKTGGAVGNVSDAEGARMENAIDALSRVQSAGDLKKALDNVIAEAQGSIKRLNDAYASGYKDIIPESVIQQSRSGGQVGGKLTPNTRGNIVDFSQLRR